MTAPGAIHDKQRYKQAKMLDHSEWFGVLPRGITPSDVDMVFSNSQLYPDRDGYCLLCEIERNISEWKNVNLGQRLVYEDLINHSERHLAVLLAHNVPPEVQIKTMSDVKTFQILFQVNGDFKVSSVIDGKFWRPFVSLFFKNPRETIDKVKLAAMKPGGLET